MSNHIAVYLHSMGEFEMAEEVLSMHNRLEAFADGLDREALDCAIKTTEEAIKQRDELLEKLEGLCSLAECRPGYLHQYKAAVNEARAAIASVKGTSK